MPDRAQTLGPYRLERVLGAGSFATVWLARDDMLDRYLAVKILADNWSQDHDVRRRFLAEAKVLLTVDSSRIVRGFHLGETDGGQPYVVMAWADRGTLEDRLDERRRDDRHFTVAEVVALGREIARAVSDVHQSGHLHRDIKPSNVLIRSTQGAGPVEEPLAGLAADETLLLGDFGLARGIDVSALTLVAGSPGYVAPEQAAGLTQLDHRADLYSVGRIMLELLTGDPGGRATTMARAANERIDVDALVETMGERGLERPPRRLIALLSRLVAEQPEERPDSAAEAVAELDMIAADVAEPAAAGGAAAGGAVPPAPPVPPAADDGAGSARRRRVVAAVAAVCIFALVGLIPLLRGIGGSGGGEAATSTELSPLASTEASADTEPTASEPAESEPAESEPAESEPAASEPSVAGPASTLPPTIPPTSEQAFTTDPPGTEPARSDPPSTGSPPRGSPPTEPLPTEPAPGPLVLPAYVTMVAGEALGDQAGYFFAPIDDFLSEVEELNPEWELLSRDRAVPAGGAAGLAVFRHGDASAFVWIFPEATSAAEGVYRVVIGYLNDGS